MKQNKNTQNKERSQVSGEKNVGKKNRGMAATINKENGKKKARQQELISRRK